MTSSKTRSGTTEWFTPMRLLAVATVIAFLASSQQWFVARLQGESAGIPFVLVLVLPFWYLWALFAPLVAWFAHRVPIERPKIALRVAFHAGMALGLSVVHSVLHVGVAIAVASFVDLPIPEGESLSLMVSLNWIQLSMNLLAYGGILGVTYAADFHRRFQEREVEAVQLEEQLAKAKLNALRMQLNPHFLFNSMNTISMMVRQRENSDAVRVIAGLSDLLRCALDDTRPQEVTLREELDFVEQYLSIEQVRFHDRLSVHIEPDEEALDAMVPNLLLQPLVENAFHHGITQRVEAGEVRITARRDDDVLVLAVRDDGPGIPPDGVGQDGVGLGNTRARLAQLYGTEPTLTLENVQPRGVTATVTLPFRLKVADDAGRDI